MKEGPKTRVSSELVFRGESLSSTRPVSHSVGRSDFSSLTCQIKLIIIVMARAAKVTLRILRFILMVVWMVIRMVRMCVRMVRMLH